MARSTRTKGDSTKRSSKEARANAATLDIEAKKSQRSIKAKKSIIKKPDRINQSYDNKTINIVFLILISAFMLVVPFYRGLFFRENYLPAIIAISAIFTAYILYRLWDREEILINTYLDFAVLAIPVAYIISFFFAANAKDAFDGILIYSSYFLIYKITGSLVKSDTKNKDIIINTIIASTFLLSFTFFLHLMEVVSLHGIFEGKRLFGLYQYPNTTASVLGVGIILALNKFIDTDDTKLKAAYQGALTSLIPTFIFTLSRGGYLVLGGVLALNFLLVNGKSKLKLLLSFFITGISSIMLIYKFYTLGAEELKTIGKYYFLGLIASIVLTKFIFAIRNKIKINITDIKVNIALIALLAVFVGAFTFLFSVREIVEYEIKHDVGEEKSWKNKSITVDKIIEPNSDYNVEFNVKSSLENPHSYGIIIRSYDKDNVHTELLKVFEPIGEEFVNKSFDFTTLEDTNKVIFLLYNYETDSYTVYKDIQVKDSNGDVIKKIDKFKYIPETIANRFKDFNLETSSSSSRMLFMKDGLKILKDYPITGAGGGAWKNLYRQYQSQPYNTTEVHNFYVQYALETGILGLVALGIVLLSIAWGAFISIKDKSPYTYIYLAVLLLFLHSAIDFNLSLVAVGYILWMLIGVLSGHEGIKKFEKPVFSYSKILLLILSAAIVVQSSTMYYGIKTGYKAAGIAKEGKDMENAISLYNKAIKLDRYNSAYRSDLAQIMNNELRKTKDKKYYDSFMEQIDMIKKNEPYNNQYTSIMCSMLLAIGKLDEAASLADAKLVQEPMVLSSYDMKIDVNYQIAKYYLENEKVEESVPFLEKALEAVGQLEKVNEMVDKPIKLKGDYPKKVEAIQNTLDMIKEDLSEENGND